MITTMIIIIIINFSSINPKPSEVTHPGNVFIIVGPHVVVKARGRFVMKLAREAGRRVPGGVVCVRPLPHIIHYGLPFGVHGRVGVLVGLRFPQPAKQGSPGVCLKHKILRQSDTGEGRGGEGREGREGGGKRRRAKNKERGGAQ